MATHSSTLARKIPWTGEPGRLQSMGLKRVGHNWATSLSLFTFMHWRRKWEPTPVFLAGESRGGGAWWAAVYGVAQSQTRLSYWTQLNWDSILKSWDIYLLAKVPIVKATVFPMFVYRCESWTIKKAENWVLWFQTCWWRLLRVSWNSKRSKQSILKESTLNIHLKDWC